MSGRGGSPGNAQKPRGACKPFPQWRELCQSPNAAVTEREELLIENTGDASCRSSGRKVRSRVSSHPQGSETGSFLVSPACGLAARPQLSLACRHIPPAPTGLPRVCSCFSASNCPYSQDTRHWIRAPPKSVWPSSLDHTCTKPASRFWRLGYEHKFSETQVNHRTAIRCSFLDLLFHFFKFWNFINNVILVILGFFLYFCLFYAHCERRTLWKFAKKTSREWLFLGRGVCNTPMSGELQSFSSSPSLPGGFYFLSN